MGSRAARPLACLACPRTGSLELAGGRAIETFVSRHVEAGHRLATDWTPKEQAKAMISWPFAICVFPDDELSSMFTGLLHR